MDQKLFAGLSPVQVQVALSLASGESLTAAAQSAGVGRTTVYDWINNEDSPFSAALREAKAEYIQTVRDQIRDLAKKSLATIAAILDDAQASPSVRLKAALAVLNRPHFPDQGWHLPEKVEPLNTQQCLESLAAIEADYRLIRYQEAIERHANRTEPNTSEHETAIPERAPAKAGRNGGQIPCGLKGGRASARAGL